MPLLPTKKAIASPYPSLRSALWLYLIVLLASAGVIIPLAYNIDPAVLKLCVALFITAGFTVVTVFLLRREPGELLGKVPEPISLAASLIAGLAIWVPSLWIAFVVYRALDTSVGAIPPPPQSDITVYGLLLQGAIIVPLCQGLLFWLFLRTAVSRLPRIQAALLLATLYGGYGLIVSTSGLGIAMIPAQFVVALVAALAVLYTDCAWYGIVIMAGYSFAWLALDNQLLGLQAGLLGYLGSDFGTNFLSLRWLLIIIIGAFVAFLMFQVIRLRATAEADPNPPAPIKQNWWLPLAFSVAFTLLLVNSEVGLRRLHPIANVQAPIDISGATIPPVASPTPVPPKSGQ